MKSTRNSYAFCVSQVEHGMLIKVSNYCLLVGDATACIGLQYVRHSDFPSFPFPPSLYHYVKAIWVYSVLNSQSGHINTKQAFIYTMEPQYVKR